MSDDTFEPVLRTILAGLSAFEHEFGKTTQKSTAAPQPTVETLIKRLNQAGVMVSIDYEPGGSYSVSCLKQIPGDNCWTLACRTFPSARDLTLTLTQAASTLGISLHD